MLDSEFVHSGFGIYLSSVLDQLTANQGPDDMFEIVSKIHTLGDMTPAVIMTLWDLELIRENGKGGKLAQILDLVDHYIRLTHEQRQERGVETDRERPAGDATHGCTHELKAPVHA